MNKNVKLYIVKVVNQGEPAQQQGSISQTPIPTSTTPSSVPPPVKPTGLGPKKFLIFVVVIALITTSIIVAFIYFSSFSQDKQIDKKRKVDIATIAQALEKSRADSLNDLYYPSAITPATLEKEGYIQKIPTDPINNAPFVYSYRGLPQGCTVQCTGYTLTACLENKNDKGENTTEPIAPCTTRTYKVSNP